MNTLLKSATIIDNSSPFHNQKKDILITNGIIEKISDSIKNSKHYQVIELERRDQREISIRPHPHEFYLYFDV